MTNLQDAMTRVDNEPELLAVRGDVWAMLQESPHMAKMVAEYTNVQDIVESVASHTAERWGKARFQELLGDGHGLQAADKLLAERLAKSALTAAERGNVQAYAGQNALRLAKKSDAAIREWLAVTLKSHTWLNERGEFVAMPRAETFPERQAREAAEQAAKVEAYKASKGKHDFSHLPKLAL